jgi:uncharacterized protein YbjT (DUF2867 family)
VILVTGATGNVGRHIVAGLHRDGYDVTAVTRTPATAAFPPEVRVQPTENIDLSGVESIFVNIAAFPDGPDEIVARAADSGVQRIVGLSTYSVGDPNPRNAIAVRHRHLEDIVRASGMEWVLPRPAGGFAMTTLEWAGSIKRERTVRAPYGEAHGAPLHEKDIAAVCLAGLTTKDLLGQEPQFSGPESISYRRRAEIISEVLGEPITFVELTDEDARVVWAEAGVPPHAIQARLGMFASMVGVSHPVDPIEPFIGRPGLTYADWVRDHIDAFR